MDPKLLIDAFLVIFIGMGPVKALIVFISMTQGVESDLRKVVARQAVMTATSVGLLLLVAGVVFMRLLHFTTSALTIAGGLILLILAVLMVLKKPGADEHTGAADESSLRSQAIYPLGIPMLLNPVGIVALTVFSAETQELVQLGVFAAMVLIVAAIDFGVFIAAHRLDRFLTRERIVVLEKLLGIMLAALAVQMILNGLGELGVITMSSGGH